MNVQEVTLDLDKEVGVGQWVRVGQGDKSGTTIRATVYDNGTAFAMSDMTAKFLMRTPSNGYVEDDHVNVSGNTLAYVVDEEHCASAAGVTDECYFQILQGDTVIASTSRFSMRVLRAATQGADPASSYSDDIVSATTAARQAADDAREAMEEIGTAVEDAAQAAESAAQAVEDAQTAVADADTAKREATSAANAATAAANLANGSANAANTAANAANAATTATNNATQRAEAAIAAMGDISEQAVPVMSADVRGGARIQPDSGLKVVGTDNLQVRLALESDGTVRGGIAELTAKGHAEQVATTGKNLLQAITTQTVHSVQFSQTDGGVRVNGTSSQAWAYAFIFADVAGYIGETLTISAGNSLPQAVYVNLVQLDESNNVITGTSVDITASNPSARSLVIATSCVKVRVSVGVSTSGTTVNTVVPIQLELGSTGTEYEPYTGGAPSPSPEFPQTIEVVRGRNLVPAVESGVIDSTNGNYADNSAYVRTQKIPVASGATYTLSLSKSYDGSAVAVVCWNEDGTFNSRLYNGGVSTKQIVATFTVPSGVNRVAFTAGASSYPETPSTVTNVQLELGSTPTPYVPYGHVGMDAKTRDLLSYGEPTNAYMNSSGVLVSDSNWRFTDFIPAKAGSMVTTGAVYVSSAAYHAFYDKNKSYIDKRAMATVIDVPSGTAFVRMSFHRLDAQDFAFTQATPIPLPSRGWVASLPDGTADSLRLDGAGKCEWELRSKKHVIANIYNATDIGNGYMRGNTIFSDTAPTNSANAFCTHAVALANYSDNTQPHFYVSGTNAYMFAEASSGAELVLAYTDAEILYPLATPVTEDCGYVDDWPTDLPDSATVSIPELDAVGVKYFIDSAATELARQWYARANSEYEDRLQALEEAMATIITGS